jgi:hypothetical protein
MGFQTERIAYFPTQKWEILDMVKKELHIGVIGNQTS